MQIIKLDATDSTNLYLKNLSVEKQLDDFTIVLAEHQVQGKGQMGAIWHSEKGKNLTFSIFKRFGALESQHRFGISMCISLAIYKCLKRFQIPDLFVKWPNDILSGKKKICGILIENVFSAGAIQSSILGVGLNVNQTDFNDIDRASSLKLIVGRTFDLEELLSELMNSLKSQFKHFQVSGFDRLKYEYEKALFRKDVPSTFKDNSDNKFTGFIRGISDTGKLKVETEGPKIVEFDLKEVSLLY